MIETVKRKRKKKGIQFQEALPTLVFSLQSYNPNRQGAQAKL